MNDSKINVYNQEYIKNKLYIEIHPFLIQLTIDQCFELINKLLNNINEVYLNKTDKLQIKNLYLFLKNHLLKLLSIVNNHLDKLDN